jgi:histidinol phosphatase-like PHP family hydrolase
MTWRPLDCHAHSTWSDGELEVPELIERVSARGVRPSISDHVSRDVSGAIDSVETLERYLEALETLPVLRGAEFCWHDSLWRDIPPPMMDRFTHRLGSFHAVWLPNGDLVFAFSRRWPDGLTGTAYVDALLDNLDRLVVEMPIDILAHPTLLPIAVRKEHPESVWTEAQEDRLVRALARSGIAFEISSRYKPHERLVRRAYAEGVRLALGSDGHRAEQVGNIDFSLSLARAIGVRDDELYDPTVHGRRA